jgi:UDP-2,3-diacylglucosamine hydrolase
LKEGKKIYFASDLHLGAPSIADPGEHEKRFVTWLDSIKNDAEEIFLVGDIFDFWYEFRYSVPKGYTRFLGKLSELTDSGVRVHIFTGNHDVWYFDYLPKECGVIVHDRPYETGISGKVFFIDHGDELGDVPASYLMMKKLFRNRTAQWLFKLIHPDLAISFARWWSKKSRHKNMLSNKADYWGDDKEWQVRFANDYIRKNPQINYFVFGHRHIAKVIPLNEKSKVIYLGDWTAIFSYAVFDGKELKLEYYNREPEHMGDK